MPDKPDNPNAEVDLTHAGQKMTLTDLLLVITAISTITAGIGSGYARSLLGAGIGAAIGLAIGVGTSVGIIFCANVC